MVVILVFRLQGFIQLLDQPVEGIIEEIFGQGVDDHLALVWAPRLLNFVAYSFQDFDAEALGKFVFLEFEKFADSGKV